MTYKFILFVCLWLTCNKFMAAQNYSVIIANSRLPTPRAFMPAIYDGDDAIYLVGGESSSFNTYNQLVKYSVSTDTIQISAINVVPTMLGSAVWSPSDQSIYYFGGYTPTSLYQSGIWKIQDDAPETLVNVGSLPVGCSWSTSIWNNGEYIYTIGGSSFGGLVDTITRYSKLNNQTDVISRTPFPVAGTSVVWDSDNNVAYIFGGYTNTGFTHDILQFNESSGDVTRLGTTLPNPTLSSCAVLIGQQVFIISEGRGPSNEFFFMKFDLLTHSLTPLVIDNYIFDGDGVACTWVETLNRIYIFGGYSSSGGYRDIIMYIDMHDEDLPTTTTTTTKLSSTEDIGSTTTEPEISTSTGEGSASTVPRYQRLKLRADALLMEVLPPFHMSQTAGSYTIIGQLTQNFLIFRANKCLSLCSHTFFISLYYLCFMGELYTFECWANYYYDENFKGCTIAQTAVCHSECPQVGTLLLPIREETCQWYKKCANGTSENYDCGIELIYNPILEACTNLGEYTCPYT